MDSIPPKRCTQCGKEYPPTAEYFYSCKSRNHALTSQCKTCLKAKTQRHRDNDPELARTRSRIASQKYRLEHPEQARENSRIGSQKWREKNIERSRETSRRVVKEWRLKNPLKKKINDQRRKAQKRSLPSTFTIRDWRRALDHFHGCCAYCQQPPSMFDMIPNLQQEHFKPITKGGGYTPDNIIPACQTCNFNKKDKDVEIWLIERFGKREAKIILKRIQDYFNGLTDI